MMVRGIEKGKIFLSRVDRGDLLSRLAEEIGSKLQLSRAQLTGGGRQRRVVEGRNLVSYVAVNGYGMTLTHVAQGLNVSIQSVIRGVNNGA